MTEQGTTTVAAVPSAPARVALTPTLIATASAPVPGRFPVAGAAPAPAPIWAAAMDPARVAAVDLAPVTAPPAPRLLPRLAVRAPVITRAPIAVTDPAPAPAVAAVPAPSVAPAVAPAKAHAPAKTPAKAPDKAPAKESRRPYHVGVAIGLSAGVYATSLAAVSVLQIDHDKRVAADRQPVGDAISMLGNHNDHLAASLSDARSMFQETSDHYGAVVADIGELHAAVGKLGKVITRIEGTSTEFRLPSMGSLPSVARGTSGGSGGSSASKPASKPAANPPPSNGGTGASG